LEEIRDNVNASKSADFTLLFDPTLVRGMSYYTGTIFEVELKEFNSSCGGGGRYDQMIGKFTGNQTPACGFSIGFERIITILLENGFRIPQEGSRVAFLVEKGLSTEQLGEVLKQAEQLRKEGNTVLMARMNKNKKFQKEQLSKEGYSEYKEFYVNSLQ
ncbi:MAG TPA: ATP phosphoribosyltransferase regulatory subunit, partial [Lachnospiraceae bacterium]|nr:ATP phosphoribosyltransferase regulatory subunit [Lachnospiraceae bacterium]